MKCWLGLLALAAVGAWIGSAGNAEPETASPYAKWKHGPSKAADHFPIGVWLQAPKNAARYQRAGINFYMGLWKGPTEAQLADLKRAGMPVICDQNEVGLKHRDDPLLIGWLQQDEPDNAQPVVDPKTKKRSYGPPVPPREVMARYERMRRRDDSRPVFLNLGQGVANDEWKGRGPQGKLSDYPGYVQATDVVSFDVYPVAGIGKPDGENYLWYVAKGLDRLREWSGGKRIIWNVLECTRISSPQRATPEQVRAEAWMSIVHGSQGLVWFVHEFKPRFNETALLDDAVMLPAVTKLNREIQSLAAVINSPEVANPASVQSTKREVPIDTMTRRRQGATYIFAVGMRNAATRGAFTVPGLPAKATAEVLNEGRSIPVRNGRFEDDFAPYGVHLYRVR